jgi:hypothetical protein
MDVEEHASSGQKPVQSVERIPFLALISRAHDDGFSPQYRRLH